MTALLDVDDNITADARVRAALQRDDPALTEQLEFDSDAEVLGIYADSEAAIRRAAEFVTRLSLA